MPETAVLDASALVEALIGTQLGTAVRRRLRGHELATTLQATLLTTDARLARARPGIELIT